MASGTSRGGAAGLTDEGACRASSGDGAVVARGRWRFLFCGMACGAGDGRGRRERCRRLAGGMVSRGGD